VALIKVLNMCKEPRYLVLHSVDWTAKMDSIAPPATSVRAYQKTPLSLYPHQIHVRFLNVVLWILVTCSLGSHPLVFYRMGFRRPLNGTVELPSITELSLDFRVPELLRHPTALLTDHGLHQQRGDQIILNTTPVAFASYISLTPPSCHFSIVSTTSVQRIHSHELFDLLKNSTYVDSPYWLQEKRNPSSSQEPQRKGRD
jgi:hypothetical protein